MGGQRWRVVGGGDKGGIVVRADCELNSEQLPERLSKGAVVAELDLLEERLHFGLLSGSGPSTGWVSLKFKDKDLLVPAEDSAVEVPLGDQQFYAGVTPLPCVERISFKEIDLWRVCRFPLADLELLDEALVGMLMCPSGVCLRLRTDTTSLFLSFRHFEPNVAHGRRAEESNGTATGSPSPIGGGGDHVKTLLRFDAFVDGEFWARGDNSPVVRGLDPNSLAPHMGGAPKPLKDPFLPFMYAMASGGNNILAEKANKLRDSYSFDRRMGVAFHGLPARDKLLEVYLPNDQTPLLESLQLDAGSSFAAAPDDRPLWVTYGSSISHGVPFANGPSGVWPVVASHLANVRVQSLGAGGQCHGDQAVARLIRDQRGIACISVKFGINVHNMSTLSERTFFDVLFGFLQTVREGHPTTPLAVISPVYGCWREDEGFVMSQSLKAMRRDVELAVRTLQRRGDKNIHYLNGCSLLGEGDVARMPDELHPDGDAHELMGHRFAKLAFGRDGVLLPGRVDDAEMDRFEPPLRPKSGG